MIDALLRSEDLGLRPDFSGKVRDLFDLGERLLIVATDRISAYDVVMKEPVVGKGVTLTQISVEWFRFLEPDIAHHLISADWRDFPEPFRREELAGRSMLVHKTERMDLECVVRGYLVGSGLKDYRASGAVCGIPLAPGLEEADAFDNPIFTPSTKAEEGHDENIDYAGAKEIVGPEWFDAMKEMSLDIYRRGAEYARERGIIIADTKFEFGIKDGRLMLIDEVLTPDSSRFWATSDWRPGKAPASYDKQILRNWLDEKGWDHNPPPPALPAELRDRVHGRYREILQRLFPEAGGVA